jgi:CheY-like chemotaxis protein
MAEPTLASEVLDTLDEALFVVTSEGGVQALNAPARSLASDSALVEALVPLSGSPKAGDAPHKVGLRRGDHGFSIDARRLSADRTLLVVSDVTRQKRRDEALFEAKRALFAAGVGEEIEGPAGVALSNLRSIEKELARLLAQGSKLTSESMRPLVEGFLHKAHAAVADTANEVARIQVVATELRAPRHPDAGAFEHVDVNAALGAALDTLDPDIGGVASVERSFGAPRVVLSNVAGLERAFFSLFVRAFDTFGERSASPPEARPSLRVRSFEEGDRVVVELSDSIPPAASDAEEPPIARRMGGGVGLDVARAFVRASGGELTVSREGAIRVSLPALKDAAAQVSAQRATGTEVRRVRLLAIDDEALLLNAYRRMMRKSHDVETVAGGREALERLEVDRDFDVILCDLQMPQVSGIDVYEAVAKRWPHLRDRFIFLTGGVFTARSRTFLERNRCTCLEKPIELAALLAAIAAKLD